MVDVPLSRFTGVNWQKGKWVSRLSWNGTTHYLGSYGTEEEAASAYRDKYEELKCRPSLVCDKEYVPPDQRNKPRHYRRRYSSNHVGPVHSRVFGLSVDDAQALKHAQEEGCRIRSRL